MFLIPLHPSRPAVAQSTVKGLPKPPSVDKGKGKQEGLPPLLPFAPQGKGKSKTKNWNMQNIRTK
eukprot:9477453-Karenia_brevis.AAC.1